MDKKATKLNLEYENIDEIKREILNIIKKYLNLRKCKIFFFGSRVVGNNRSGSDIDIGIEYEGQPIPLHTLSEIKEEIEKIPTLYLIDLVDFGRVSSDFKKDTVENREVIYEE